MSVTWGVQLGISPVLQSGDVVLALFQAVSAQLVFIQAQIQLVNAVARAQTSVGADVDTFVGQFGFTRLPGTSATGVETFSTIIAAASSISIPVGTVVQTPGGAISYVVVADANNSAFNSALNAYVLAVGQTSVNATIQAVVTGSTQNVSAGQLTQLQALIPGITSVTNASKIDNGLDAEGDSPLLARFILWLNSLSKAIKPAIEAAILSTRQGLIYNLLENENFFNQTLPFFDDATFFDRPQLVGFPALHFDPGNFMAIVDDGSGSPPQSLLDQVYASIDAVRGFTIKFEVFAPIVVTVNVSLTIQTASTTNHENVVGTVQTAIANYVNGLSINATSIPLTRLAQVAYDASSLVIGVPLGSILINNSAQDLALSVLDVPRAGTINVT